MKKTKSKRHREFESKYVLKWEHEVSEYGVEKLYITFADGTKVSIRGTSSALVEVIEEES